jgi:DNA-binding transcriptional LysR family regulator
MATNLPTELLRSFVAIVDSGSMLRATERVFVTQSALSLQMKRLEETVLTPLFHRDGRRLVLTSAGQTLLPRAREILALNDRAVVALTGDALAGPARVGLVQDFAETLLSGVLARFSKLNPETQLQVRVAGSPELLDLLGSDRLDVVLCMGAADDPPPLGWRRWSGTATKSWRNRQFCRSPFWKRLPVPRRGPGGAGSERARLRVALETPSLSALRAAVQAGLAVTCRTALFLPGTPPLEEVGLPALPQVAYVRRTNDSPHASISKLSQLVHAAAIEL